MLDDAEELYTQLWPTFFAAPANARTTESVRTITIDTTEDTENSGEASLTTMTLSAGETARACVRPGCGRTYSGTRRTPCPGCGNTRTLR